MGEEDKQTKNQEPYVQFELHVDRDKYVMGEMATGRLPIPHTSLEGRLPDQLPTVELNLGEACTVQITVKPYKKPNNQ